jgi:predicted RNA-binding Zn-ribbon protein involved in translation (DUF1610 family)
MQTRITRLQIMSMLGCSCGETIYDRTDNLPYKGYAIADTQMFELLSHISTEIADYIRARLAGTEDQWLSEYFRSNTKMDEQELVHTIITRHLLHEHIKIYQCPKCGRVHIAHRDRSQLFERFTPEASPHRDIFQK